jgi:hypothetical protein
MSMGAIWIVLNVMIYGIGIAVYSQGRIALGTILTVFGSTGCIIGLLKLLFHTQELWMIFVLGGPLLLLANLVAMAVAKHLQTGN